MKEATVGKPTRYRWFVLFMLCMMYLITYMDRVNIAAAAPLITKEFGFSKITMGLIFSAYAWGYALFQVPGGWMGDRFGPRKVLSTIVAYWSLMTAVTAQGVGLASFTIIRFVFGIGESGAFPTATRGMQLWFMPEERGICQGITHSASRFGAAIVPPLVVTIMVHYGWRMVFYTFGVGGLLFSLIWYLMYRDLPEDHKWVNMGELARIRGVDATGNINPPKVTKRPKVPWGVLLKHPNMWAVMCCHFAYCYCLWIFLTWLPAYLVEYRGFTLLKMGYFASLPLFAGVIGDGAGGWLTDYLLKRTGNIRFARRAVAVTGMLGAAACIVPAAMTRNPYTAVYCLTAAMLFLECIIGPAWAVPMDVGGEYSGTVSGMMNMAGNVGAAISPTVFGILVQFGSWVAPFVVAAVILLAGAVGWAFWLDPEISVLEKGRIVAKSIQAASAGSGR
jgi:sugar phosphate permease